MFITSFGEQNITYSCCSNFLIHLYLKAYDTVKQAKQSIAEYLDFYNMIRPHSSLNKATPNEFYDQHLLKVMAA